MVTWLLPGWLRTKKQDAEATLLDQPGPLSSQKVHPAPKFSSFHTFPFNIVFSKGKGVHGPKDSLNSMFQLFPLLSPLGVSWDGMQGGEVEKGASVSFLLPSGDSRVSMITTPLSSSFTFSMALNVSASSNRPYLLMNKLRLDGVKWLVQGHTTNKRDRIKDGPREYTSRWAEGSWSKNTCLFSWFPQ